METCLLITFLNQSIKQEFSMINYNFFNNFLKLFNAWILIFYSILYLIENFTFKWIKLQLKCKQCSLKFKVSTFDLTLLLITKAKTKCVRVCKYSSTIRQTNWIFCLQYDKAINTMDINQCPLNIVIHIWNQ